jgi:hypothetical protein
MSIRGIGIDRNFRWTGFGPEAGARLPEALSPKQPFMHIADSLTTRRHFVELRVASSSAEFARA